MPLDEAMDEFDSRQVSAVLIIPVDFTLETLQAGTATVELKQVPNRTNALIDEQAVRTAISRVSSVVDIAAASTTQAEARRPFTSSEERATYFENALVAARDQMESAPQRVSEVTANTADPIDYDPHTNSSFGQMITWVFIPLIGLSAMFAQGAPDWHPAALARHPHYPGHVHGRHDLWTGAHRGGADDPAGDLGVLVLKINWAHSSWRWR